VLAAEVRCSSASRRFTTSPAGMRFDGALCQHRSIMPHILSETWRWSGRGGLAPFSVKHAVVIPAVLKNGAFPVKICFESEDRTQRLCGAALHTSQATAPNANMSPALVGESTVSQGVEAEPKPAIRTVPFTSTSMFV